jgi:signal peptidase I
MNSLRRLALSLGFASLIVLVAGAVSLALLMVRHERLLSVQTASMVPTFQPGDALIVNLRDKNPVVGAVITYRSADNPRVLITHRLIGVERGRLITAGDATSSRDKPVSRQAVVGTATTALPGMGRWLDRLHQPLALLMLIYIPAALAAAFEIKRLSSRLKPPQYRVLGYR